jgi:hypothetical protein
MSGMSRLRRHLKCKDAPPCPTVGAFMEAFNKAIVDSGELVETRGLTAPVHTRRIQLQNGAPVVTDGPYAETQEVPARPAAPPGAAGPQRVGPPLRPLRHRRGRNPGGAHCRRDYLAKGGSSRQPARLVDLIGKLQNDSRLAEDYRLHAVRAHLQEMAGEVARARDSYLAAADRAPNLPQRRYLHARAARLTG